MVLRLSLLAALVVLALGCAEAQTNSPAVDQSDAADARSDGEAPEEDAGPDLPEPDVAEPDSAESEDTADASPPCFDPDGDGYGEGDDCLGGDCDETNTDINKGATEVCDGVDNNCDGEVNEGLAAEMWPDADNDKFGATGSESQLTCIGTEYFATNNDDCDDERADINPQILEQCDGVDNNCDGAIDEELTIERWPDADLDGYGALGSAVETVCPAAPGYADNDEDCADENDAVSPDAIEVCDLVDNNCDDVIDEGLRAMLWPDLDGDGHGGRDSEAVNVCADTAGYAATNLDCDDGDGALNPDVAEVCDLVDNNCDDAIDEGLRADLYPDLDGDGYGDQNATTENVCSDATGFAADNTDCDDGRSDRYPGAPELCDATDNDCDPEIDEGVTPRSLGQLGACAGNAETCESGVWVPDPTNVTPVAETCDGIDNDCSGFIDESAGCPCEIRQVGDHAYAFCEQNLTYTAARTHCQSFGYHLVTVSSAAEDAWLASQDDIFQLCSDTCPHYDDWDCDDGGPWSDYSLCDLGTDCTDCGVRVAERMWIGLSDLGTEGTFVWDVADGTSYTHWNSGEPNDSGGEDCTELIFSSGVWNDNQCSNVRPYVCEAP